MSKGVVDRLEFIEIEVMNGEGIRTALRRGEALVQTLEKGRAVREAREPIGARQESDLLLRSLAFGDIDHNAFDLDKPPLLIAHRYVAVFHPTQGPVPGAQAKLNRGAFRMTFQDTSHRLAHLGMIVCINQILRPVGRSEQGLRVVTQFSDVVRDVNEWKRRLAAQAIENHR